MADLVPRPTNVASMQVPVDPLDASISQLAEPGLTEENHGSLLEQGKAAVEGGLEAATLGTSTGLESALFHNEKDINERRKTAGHGVGQVAGLVLPSLIGEEAGLLGAVGKAGTAASEAAGLGLEGASLASRVGAHAVKNGIESALISGGDEVSKMLSSDPNQTAQTAAANVGLSGLLGGALGGGLGAAGELWTATIGKKLGSSLDAASHAIETPAEPGQLTMLQQALGEPALNSQEAIEAADRLGVELPTGSLNQRQVIRDLARSTSERPTVAGQALHSEYRAAHEGLNKSGQEILRDATLKTESQIGKEIKEGLASKLEEELKPLEQKYESLKGHMENMELSDAAKTDASNSLLDHELVKIAPSSKAAKLAENLAEEINGLKNVAQVKTYRTLINKRLEAAFRAGGEELPILQAAKKSLTDLREHGITEATQATGIGRGGGSISSDTIAELRGTDSAYAAYKKKLQGLGVEAGLGNVNSARALLSRFSKLSDESFATRVFDLNDINQMKYMQEHFPKEFELARRYKLREIAEKSISHAEGRGNKFDVGKFLSQTSDVKMNPEAREMLFGGNVQKLKDIRTIYGQIPGSVTFGSAKAHMLGHVFSPQGIVDNLSDAAKYAFLKSLPHLEEAIKHAGGSDAAQLAALKFAANTEKGVDPGAFRQMTSYIEKTMRGESLISKATKNVFHAGEIVLPSNLIPNDKDREKLDKKLKHLSMDNSSLFQNDKIGHYLPEHGTAIAQTSANAVGYLNSLRPDTTKKGPLDSEPVVSKTKKAEFNRALDIAEQPLLVMQAVKDGTVTPADITHLHVIYPGLSDRLSQKLLHNMMEHVDLGKTVPYKTRLGLSMFTAQPLDSTMTPQAIIAAQPKQAQPQQSQQTGGARSMKALSKAATPYQTQLQARQAATISHS